MDLEAAHETPRTIWQWMLGTFGYESQSDLYQITRAIDELHEALEAIAKDEENTHKMSEEIADTIIVLYGALGKRGYNVQALVDQKMAINRQRQWEWVNGKWEHVKGG